MGHPGRFMALLALVLTACGGGGGGGGNEERVIAVFPVAYDFATSPTPNTIPFCFANIDCGSLALNDRFGVALTLLDVPVGAGPGIGPILRSGQASGFDFLAQTLTDNQVGPIAAAFMVDGQVPGCVGDDESDLQLQEARPVLGVDLVGFDVTGVALSVEAVSRTPTQVTMTGRVLIFGKTATP